MNTLSKFEKFYYKIKRNRWYWLFSLFCRFGLALAFIFAGYVKIIDEKFASGLSVKHPMGAYLEALHQTGFYYTFIGIVQILAAVLLIIPRTVTLGAVLYFPVILNIWILSFALRFEGSFVTAPLMVFANLYLLVWNYDRLKYILPFKNFEQTKLFVKPKSYTTKFPVLFFSGVVSCVALTIILAQFGYEVMPRNSISDCREQFKNTTDKTIGFNFCDCIHNKGKSLNTCLEAFEKSKAKK
ncbi:DoxX family protein [Haloflavibacter putidus]|uniref:DoxX family protein n=1 Tax=Haloflavibacter putidus TaxID=2576776 RepID=A0A507ZS98_9FLAO|nr:DoxX family protein [Haloflavibacter putidus]TQD39144.1 DoxX family protein [Haloflavibacter putidus]